MTGKGKGTICTTYTNDRRLLCSDNNASPSRKGIYKYLARSNPPLLSTAQTPPTLVPNTTTTQHHIHAHTFLACQILATMRFIKLALFVVPLAHSVSAMPILGLLPGLLGGGSPSPAPAPVSTPGDKTAAGVLGIVENLNTAVVSLIS